MSAPAKQWTLEELHRLPEDGNKYELIRGVLFVTPAPSVSHETILARLSSLLYPYVARHGLGYIYRPRSVVRFEGSEVEPDLMVRKPPASEDNPDWELVPTPFLVVEVASRSTRRCDRQEKREFYRDAGVAEYWMIDAETRTITVAKANGAETNVVDVMTWQSEGVSEVLTFSVGEVFGTERLREG